MTDKIVVFSACQSDEEAQRIAKSLVEKHLAACVTLLPGVQSIYRWKGDIEQSCEIVLMIKSNRECFQDLRLELEKMHSYEVPEVLALPVVDGALSYVEWMNRELRRPE